jgi:uncharacterized protein (DUF1778 family)
MEPAQTFEDILDPAVEPGEECGRFAFQFSEFLRFDEGLSAQYVQHAHPVFSAHTALLPSGSLPRGFDVSAHLPYSLTQEVLIMTRSTSPRKSASPARAERLGARVSRDQKALFQRAAELQGRTLTDFVVSSLHEAAVRTIEEMQIIRLSAEDSRAFADALLHPRTPNEKLRAAARRYMETLGG